MNKLLIFLGIFATFSLPAYGYIDPGSGSYLFQILIAGLIGFIFYIKTTLKKVIQFIFRFFSKKKRNGTQ